MCNPMVMAVTSVFSTVAKMQQDKAQADYQKGIAEYNARVDQNEAQTSRNAATEKENIQRRRTAELISKQKAQLGAANVNLFSGTAFQLQEDAATLGEVDALRIRQTGDDQYNALQQKATLTRSQGAMAQAAGQNKAMGTLFSGVGSVMGTGVADKWFTPDSVAAAS